MVDQEPSTTLCPSFSSADAVPTAWPVARRALQDAALYWLSTVRPDGRPHVTPLLGVWFEGALYFSTGPEERKAENLAQSPGCVLTTGRNDLAGLDLVVEGHAVTVTDDTERARVAATFEGKYGAHFAHPDGTWAGLGDAIRQGDVLLYRVAPSVAFGFGKGGPYSQTRWKFS